MGREVDAYSAYTSRSMPIPGWLLLLYLAGVVYGSLIPFELRPHTLPGAWDEFLHIRYLRLGIVSRADWIANILLYIPLGFLVVGWLHSSRRRYSPNAGIAALAFIFCSLVAFTVEFVQIFFAPRTVSINDLIAEHLGSLLGIILWIGSRNMIWESVQRLVGGGHRAIQSSLILYAAAYVVLSLFPYDFILSVTDLKWKLETDNYGWLVAGAGCQKLLICVLKLVFEAVATAPLGVLLFMRRSERHGDPIIRAFIAGALLGFMIEVGQFLTVSGMAQGVSVVSRAIGVAAGAWLMAHYQTITLHIKPHTIKKLIAIGVVPYLLIVVTVNGWFSASWITPGEGLQSIRPEMFLPFYYHYFTTEVHAVQSVLANFGLYFPIGLVYWINCRLDRTIQQRGWFPVLVAALFAMVMETGKLFIPDRHPDPTNIIIAAAAAGLAWRAAMWMQMQTADVTVKKTITEHPPQMVRRSTGVGPSLTRLLALLLLLIIVLVLSRYPLHAVILGSGLCAYAVVLWIRPAVWLIFLPALLPMANFSPWTGWLYVDELDLVILTTVAMNLWVWSPAQKPLPFPGTLKILLLLVLSGYLGSLAIGFLPFQVIDANTFIDYYSNYNALRVGKAMLWAVLLLPLIVRAMERPERAFKHFTIGMLLGLSGVIAMTIWERWTFPGLLNFSTQFRTAAMFYEMHAGGAYIDAYLAAALPFVAACFLIWRNGASYVCGTALFGLGMYALFVTFSRTNYLAFAVSALIIFVGLLRSGLSERRFYWVTVTLAIVMAMVITPILSGPYIQSRFAMVWGDFNSRLDHWAEALDIRSQDLTTSVLGMGLGSYPRAAYLYHLGEGMPQTIRYHDDNGDTFLRLGAGSTALYVLQKVVIAQAGNYRIQASIRPQNGQGAVVAMLCEKTLLYSLKCGSATLQSKSEPGRWVDVEAAIDIGNLGQANGHGIRPVSFGMYNKLNNSYVDIDNIRLTDPGGEDIIANGDFSHGQERWFFTVDDLQSWHISNLWIQVLFEQGWFGLVLVMVLMIYTLKELGTAAWSGSAQHLIMLSSLSGFLVIGVSDSLFDAPRLGLLFWMLVFFSLVYNSIIRESGGGKQALQDLPEG